MKPANRLLAGGNQRLLRSPWSELVLGVSKMEFRCELRCGTGKAISRLWLPLFCFVVVDFFFVEFDDALPKTVVLPIELFRILKHDKGRL